MKRSINSLIGFTMGATDGEIGKVKEFYFDDETWTIRYLIVETGSWLFGREVLISPQALLAPDWEDKIFPINLTKEQVKNSPDIDTKQPVSRQEEIRLQNFYEWTTYWGGGFYGGGMPLPMNHAKLEEKENLSIKKAKGDIHLRSSAVVIGYKIKADYGEIGTVEDFLIDDSSWKIDFMLVDTGDLLPGKKVLISPSWIKEIDWETSAVTVNATVDSIKNSPEYDHTQPLTDAYSKLLHNYYRTPVY